MLNVTVAPFWLMIRPVFSGIYTPHLMLILITACVLTILYI